MDDSTGTADLSYHGADGYPTTDSEDDDVLLDHEELVELRAATKVVRHILFGPVVPPIIFGASQLFDTLAVAAGGFLFKSPAERRLSAAKKVYARVIAKMMARFSPAAKAKRAKATRKASAKAMRAKRAMVGPWRQR